MKLFGTSEKFNGRPGYVFSAWTQWQLAFGARYMYWGPLKEWDWEIQIYFLCFIFSLERMADPLEVLCQDE